MLMMRSLNTTVFGTEEEHTLGSFMRRKLKRLSNWNVWLLSEAKQLDSMVKQGMYGTAVYPPAGATILHSTGTTPSSLVRQERYKIAVIVPLAPLRL
jgi:hypothetical protein